MARIETLTAYKLTFSYLQRNNPLLEKQRQAIKAHESPQYDVEDFLADYTSTASKLTIGANTDRAISLQAEKLTAQKIGSNATRWHLVPRSGKQGTPVTVMKISSLKEYNFGADSAALYDHHVYIYENADSVVAVFHRQNGSGCKSVFLETANEVLRPKGLKLEMDLYIPISDALAEATPTKITLQYTRTIPSSDIADNYNGSQRKREIVRDLGLNLEVADNSKIFAIFRNMQLGRIKQAEAFAQIKAACSDDGKYIEDYNDAEIKLRIGKRKRTIKWDDFERSFGSYDISEALHSACKDQSDFIPALTKLADEYYSKIIEAEDSKHAN